MSYRCGSLKDDWAIFERTDANDFPVDWIVPFSTNVPDNAEEAKIKVYHCPISPFNEENIDAVMPASVEGKIAFCTNHALFFQIALFSGSSGGLVVLADGKAIGMHTEAITQTIGLDEVDPNMSFEESMTAVSNSCVNSTGVLSKALLLPKFPKLIRVVTELNFA